MMKTFSAKVDADYECTLRVKKGLVHPTLFVFGFFFSSFAAVIACFIPLFFA
jgi:hypothetical protein